jgi:hypothetical protein
VRGADLRNRRDLVNPAISLKPVFAGQFDCDRPDGLENEEFAAHIRGMAGKWTTEQFTCPECGMNYTATKEQHPDRHSGNPGSFQCVFCETEVHAWTGLYDFFDWKTVKSGLPVFGKKTATAR